MYFSKKDVTRTLPSHGRILINAVSLGSADKRFLLVLRAKHVFLQSFGSLKLCDMTFLKQFSQSTVIHYDGHISIFLFEVGDHLL